MSFGVGVTVPNTTRLIFCIDVLNTRMLKNICLHFRHVWELMMINTRSDHINTLLGGLSNKLPEKSKHAVGIAHWKSTQKSLRNKPMIL